MMLGPYELRERLGSGGMGEIFRARRLGASGFQKDVAIKRPWRHLASDPEVRERFIEEAKLGALLVHPNIVQVDELRSEGGTYFMVMEYVHGTTLALVRESFWAHGQAFPVAEAVAILRALLEALHYTHVKTDPQGVPLLVVHRDVSPENVLLSVDGIVKLADFGVAKAANRPMKTRTGVRHGKPIYASPEQARGLPVDARADVYSVGVIAFELFASKRWQGDARLPDSVPPSAKAVIQRALEPEVDARFASARAFADALAAAHPEPLPHDAVKLLVMAMPLASEKSEVKTDVRPEPEAPEARPPTKWQRRFAHVPAAALVVLAAYLVWPARTPPPAPAAAPSNVPAAPLPPASVVTAPDGYLSVNALPWGRVFVDGVSKGVTPLWKLRLPAGEHQLRVECGSDSRVSESQIQVTAGETSVKRIQF